MLFLVYFFSDPDQFKRYASRMKYSHFDPRLTLCPFNSSETKKVAVIVADASARYSSSLKTYFVILIEISGVLFARSSSFVVVARPTTVKTLICL